MGCLWSEQFQHYNIKIQNVTMILDAIKLGPKRGLIDQEEGGSILIFCHFSTTNKATIGAPSAVGGATGPG